jgi:hypothetical protein
MSLRENTPTTSSQQLPQGALNPTLKMLPVTSSYLKFGNWSDDNMAAAEAALNDLKALRDNFASRLGRSAEFFEPSLKLDAGSRKTRIAKLKYYNQTSLLQAVLLKYEFALKLLSSLDGYILAAENKQPLLVYLTVR